MKKKQKRNAITDVMVQDRHKALGKLDYILDSLKTQARTEKRLVATLRKHKSKITGDIAFRLDAILNGGYFNLVMLLDVTKQVFDKCPKSLEKLVIPDCSYRESRQ